MNAGLGFSVLVCLLCWLAGLVACCLCVDRLPKEETSPKKKSSKGGTAAASQSTPQTAVPKGAKSKAKAKSKAVAGSASKEAPASVSKTNAKAKAVSSTAASKKKAGGEKLFAGQLADVVTENEVKDESDAATDTIVTAVAPSTKTTTRSGSPNQCDSAL